MSILFVVTMLSICWISFVFTIFIFCMGVLLREDIIMQSTEKVNNDTSQ
jgi:hypothetical protein